MGQQPASHVILFYNALYCVLIYGTHPVRKQDNFPVQLSKDTQFPYALHSGPDARKYGVRLPVRVFPILSSTATRPVWDPTSFVLCEYYDEGGGGGSEGKAVGI